VLAVNRCCREEKLSTRYDMPSITNFTAWCAKRSIAAELMSGFEKTLGHSPKSRFEVMIVDADS
jgi:hypothetical protein